MPAANIPRRPPRVSWLGMLLALLLLVLGALAAFEALALLGWIREDPVATPVLGQEVSAFPDVRTTALGAAMALVGLWLLWTALLPGRRRGVRLKTQTGVWMTASDLSRLAAGTAEDVDGVLSADATVGKRKADVRVETTAPQVRDTVRTAVADRLSALERPPQVVVHDNPRHEGGSA
jgi:hypothetical protein